MYMGEVIENVPARMAGPGKPFDGVQAMVRLGVILHFNLVFASLHFESADLPIRQFFGERAFEEVYPGTKNEVQPCHFILWSDSQNDRHDSFMRDLTPQNTTSTRARPFELFGPSAGLIPPFREFIETETWPRGPQKLRCFFRCFLWVQSCFQQRG
jgi:hypothetical protein